MAFLSKRLLFDIHSWIGIKLSILFFIVCFSGTLAVFSHELDWLFNPEMRATPQQQRASKNLVVNNLKKVYPDGEIVFWSGSREPYLTDIIMTKVNGVIRYVFANPYTGEIQGSANLTIQRFFRDLHYYLFIPFQVGNFIVLFFGFVLLISLITGIVSYKQWYKKLFVLTTGKGSNVFFRSLHRLVGVWSIPFMALISVTGIWYFVERADLPKISPYLKVETPPLDSTQFVNSPIENFTYHLDYDRCVNLAEKSIPHLEVSNLFIPSKKGRPVYITGLSKVPLVRFRANRVYINPYNYEVIKVQRAESINTITWINDIADPLHFGYWGGWITKVVWFIFGMAISGLILTGTWISLKRKIKNITKLKKKRMGKWRYVNWVFVIAIQIFMYILLIKRYRISMAEHAIITVSWILVFVIGYYIFSYRVNANKHSSAKSK